MVSSFFYISRCDAKLKYHAHILFRLIMDYIEQSYCANFSPWIGNFGDILELLIDLIEI